MSAIAESLRRGWMPVAALGVVAIAGIIWLLTLHYTAPIAPASNLPQAAPASEQAPWHINQTVEAKSGKLTEAQKKIVAARGDGAVTLVKNVFDGIFLEPQTLDDVVNHDFSSDAAHSLNARHLGFPDGATNVTTLSRRADVGIEAAHGKFATATVDIMASAQANSKLVKVKQEATLWIERDGSDWRVIAFDVDQRPAK